MNGGHTLTGREIVKTIALRLGNAIAMPVLPRRNNARCGTAGHDWADASVLARFSNSSSPTRRPGFKNVVLMGDHGGGQPATYADVAKEHDARPEGKRVFDEVYANTHISDKWLAGPSWRAGSQHLHDAVSGGDKGWVRKELIHRARRAIRHRRLAHAGSAAADRPIPTRRPGRTTAITSDARRSTAALGKMAFDVRDQLRGGNRSRAFWRTRGKRLRNSNGRVGRRTL